jgi:hypothetical protein
MYLDIYMYMHVYIYIYAYIYIDSEAIIAQFPYQDISSWGSSATLFQFTVFNYIKKNSKNSKNEEKKYSDLETRIDDALNRTDSISIDTMSDKKDISIKEEISPKSKLGTSKPLDVLIIKDKNGMVIENVNKSDRSANVQNRSISGGRKNQFLGDDIIVKIKTIQAMVIEVFYIHIDV